jgi:hypothetical protein
VKGKFFPELLFVVSIPMPFLNPKIIFVAVVKTLIS